MNLPCLIVAGLPRLILPVHLLVLKNFSQNCVSFAYGNRIADLVGMLRS
jgi:hypothetical protein